MPSKEYETNGRTVNDTMCEFVSWVEASTEGEPVLLCLTAKDLRSSKGRKLKGRIGEDINGHGAIREYYDLKPGFGVDKECTDFSTPDNFPAEIVEHIKAGDFRGFGDPEGLLNDPAWAECERVCDTAWAEYVKIHGLAHAKYEKIHGPAWAEYVKIHDLAYAEFEKVRDPTWAEFEKVRDLAYAEFEKVRDPALAEYVKVRDLAYAEFEKTCDTKFWDLFSKPENRLKQWKGGE